jgi:predicted Ser/Thr protein kinase
LAHPPSCLKGLISGELRRYWLQNNLKDFQDILAKFIQRLTLRGHKLKDLIPIFQQAAAQLELKQTSNKNANTNNQNTLFIHWQFHPQGIQRRELRHLYSNLLKPYLDFDKVTIAVSRPKNLRDLLTNARLDYKLEHLLHNKTDIQTNPE